MQGSMGAKENPAVRDAYAGVYGGHENLPEMNSLKR